MGWAEAIRTDVEFRSSFHASDGRLVGSVIRRYGIAATLVAAAFLASLVLQPLFPHPFVFLFFAAIMASGWFGGTLPGLFAVLLSTVMVEYFFFAPFYSFAIKATELSYFAAFVACSLVASWVSASKKKSEEALKDARNQLQLLVADRTAELHKSNAELRENERGLRVLAEVLPQQIWSGIAEGSAESSALSLPEVLAQVVEIVVSLIKCDSCFVYVLEGDHLVLRASKNPHAGILDRLKLKLGQGITGWVGQHRQPVALEEKAWEDARFQVFSELPEDRFEAFLSVPMVSRGQLVGVINLQKRAPHRYNEREIRMLTTIGFLVGAEIKTANLESGNTRLTKKLESRKVIERAKGIIQREMKMNEEEAYLTLQRESRQKSKSMKEIAEAILLNEEIKHREK